MKSRFQSSVLCAVLGVAVCYVAVSNSARHAAAQPAPAKVTWEYTTANVDTGSLQTKLNELGDAGWEVFTVTITDSKVDTGADGVTRLLPQRLEVLGKRLKK